MPWCEQDTFPLRAPLPTRRENNDLWFKDHVEFTPNLSPAEVLQAGAFGGTYFRSITSAISNLTYEPSEVLAETVDPDWIKDLNPELQLTSQIYRKEVNKYGVEVGESLALWECSHKITNLDPYGWFQWYCRFYRGRRGDDDRK